MWAHIFLFFSLSPPHSMIGIIPLPVCLVSLPPVPYDRPDRPDHTEKKKPGLRQPSVKQKQTADKPTRKSPSPEPQKPIYPKSAQLTQTVFLGSGRNITDPIRPPTRPPLGRVGSEFYNPDPTRLFRPVGFSIPDPTNMHPQSPVYPIFVTSLMVSHSSVMVSWNMVMREAGSSDLATVSSLMSGRLRFRTGSHHFERQEWRPRVFTRAILPPVNSCER